MTKVKEAEIRRKRHNKIADALRKTRSRLVTEVLYGDDERQKQLAERARRISRTYTDALLHTCDV